MGEGNPRAFLNHVNIALGSEAELATHLHVSVRLGLCSEEQTHAISKRREYVGRMLNRLAEALKRRVESEARRTAVSRRPDP
jgi:four helix bundle protein